MNASKKKRIDGPFERFHYDGLHVYLIRVFDEVFNQLPVVVEEKHKPYDWEEYCEEEKVYHDDIGHFVGEVEAKEVFALAKKEEWKLFHVSFVNGQEKRAVEGVFPNVFWYSKVVEKSEDKRKSDIY